MTTEPGNDFLFPKSYSYINLKGKIHLTEIYDTDNAHVCIVTMPEPSEQVKKLWNQKWVQFFYLTLGKRTNNCISQNIETTSQTGEVLIYKYILTVKV